MSSKRTANKILFESPSILSGEEEEIKKADFDFEKKLGDGAFGNVWKVQHRLTKEPYALKQVAKEKVVKMQAQFCREVYIMYNLNHANIAKLYNHFEDEKYFYLIMEMCEGGNLFQRLHRQKQFMEFEAGQYFYEVLMAVQYLHSHVPAIIHRDIKPENILLDKNGRVKLTDFGWSNYYTNEKEPRTTVCGTPEYLPPEMVEQRAHDTSADIWCLGVLLYEMLVGHTPFRSQAKQSMLLNISKCKPKFPLSFPSDAKDLISRILVKKTSERLGITEILDHPWVKAIADMIKAEPKKIPTIPLPQYHGNIYLENVPVEFKCYKVIGRAKKILSLEGPNLQKSNEQITLASTRRTIEKESSSSGLSNLTLSDSELDLSESEISNELIEDIVCRESLRQLHEEIEGKTVSLKTTQIELTEKEKQIKNSIEKVNDLQNKISQRIQEKNLISGRLENYKAQLAEAHEKMLNIFPSAEIELLINNIQELKQKLISKCRESEILKKKSFSIESGQCDMEAVFSEREKELVDLRSQLEILKNTNKTEQDREKIMVLEISKQVLSSQVSSNYAITKDIIESIQREMEKKISSILDNELAANTDKISHLLSETKEKCLKIELKQDELKKRFLEKKEQTLREFKEKKEKFYNALIEEKESKQKTIAENYQTTKELLKLELQTEKLNESKFSINMQDYEDIKETYEVIPT